MAHSTLSKTPQAINRSNCKNTSNLETIKDNAQRLGLKLGTFLRLPKAQKWACCEWFTANIDITLLSGENDFRNCLKEILPKLKSRSLTKSKWCKIRRMMGKPRRCSQAFFETERNILNVKRKKIRQLQQQKVVDISYYKDLPEQIPLSLVIGTRVTALLHHPHDGLFVGTIDAVETANNGYRITFDRASIGTHFVPDYEVLSENPPEFLPLNSFQTRIKPRMPILKSSKFLEVLGFQLDEFISQKQDGLSKSLASEDEDANCGDYPLRLLALMVKVSKLLAAKKKRVSEIKSMNDEVERLTSLREPVSKELKRLYAGVVLDLEKLNSDLDEHMKAVQLFSNDLPIEAGLIPDPETIKQRCQTEAKQTVDRALTECDVKNSESIEMINHMMSLMLLLRSLGESDDNALQMKALNETISEYKSKLQPEKLKTYEDNIEIHVNYIKNTTNSQRKQNHKQ